MNSKKTSKTTPKQNTKRYLLFIENIANWDSVCEVFIGSYVNKAELQKVIASKIDLEDLDEIVFSIYDTVNDCWLKNVKVAAGEILLSWDEPT